VTQSLLARVARFFLDTIYQKEEDIRNDHEIYRIEIIYSN
jgi:hypothetical protein